MSRRVQIGISSRRAAGAFTQTDIGQCIPSVDDSNFIASTACIQHGITYSTILTTSTTPSESDVHMPSTTATGPRTGTSRNAEAHGQTTMITQYDHCQTGARASHTG